MIRIINIVLLLAVIGMSYWSFRLIKDPIEQAKVHKMKKEAIISRLKDIRKAEFAYREIHGHFTGSFDSLLKMIRRDTFQLVRTIGDPNDTTIQVQRDTLLVPVRDSLTRVMNNPVDSLPYVPYTDTAQFELKADVIKKGGVRVPVFLARDSKPYDPDKVWQVGSLSEATYSGNFE